MVQLPEVILSSQNTLKALIILSTCCTYNY